MRFALGAQRGDVLRLIVGQGMRLVVIGVALGFGGIFALTRLLQSLLFGIGAADLTTMFGVTIILGVIAFVACWLHAPLSPSVPADPAAAGAMPPAWGGTCVKS